MSKSTFYVVHDFMVTELGLSGNDLTVYAIIYGFSQDGESVFSGSRAYLAKWCNSTVRSVQNNLNRLMQLGLIEQTYHRKDNREVCYRATRCTSEKSSPETSSPETSEKSSPEKFSPEKSSPNNIDKPDNIDKPNSIVRPYTNVYGDSEESSIKTSQENISTTETNKPIRKRLFDTDDTVESKPKRKKGNLFERCVEEAKNRYHDELLTVVLDYLNYRCKSKMHGFGFQAWVNLLNKLDRLADFDQEKIKIVEQSLQMKWDTFAELRTWGKKTGCERFGETEDMRSGVPVGEVLDIQF